MNAQTGVLLALTSGFRVEATDGSAGLVETPLFPPDVSVPDFLVLRVGRRLHRRRPVLPATLVESVEPSARIVRVRARRIDVERLPEHLPLAI